jgi:GH25 family lysozyme M1 (1,4-beta-N-acetylmuramidase)
MTGSYGQDWASYQPPAPPTAGLTFAFAKATEGTTYQNPEYTAQTARAVSGGLVPGAYHYPHMADQVTVEADYFLAHAAVKPGHLVVLDWEGYDAANAGVPLTRQFAYKEAWLAYVKGKLPHNPVGLYCNKDYWLDVDTSGYYQDFLWIATSGLLAGAPGIDAPWLFHQYAARTVDLDYCHLEPDALRAWVAAFTPAAPPPVPAKPKVSLKNTVYAAEHDPQAAQGHTTRPADVKPVEAALRLEGLLGNEYAYDGSFGSATVAAYAALQRRRGYRGADADGIPGKTTLTWLGTRHGFTVTA